MACEICLQTLRWHQGELHCSGCGWESTPDQIAGDPLPDIRTTRLGFAWVTWHSTHELIVPFCTVHNRSHRLPAPGA